MITTGAVGTAAAVDAAYGRVARQAPVITVAHTVVRRFNAHSPSFFGLPWLAVDLSVHAADGAWVNGASATFSINRAHRRRKWNI
jgi:hypothetical protein